MIKNKKSVVHGAKLVKNYQKLVKTHNVELKKKSIDSIFYRCLNPIIA